MVNVVLLQQSYTMLSSKSKKQLETMLLKYSKQLWTTSCLYLKYVHVVLVVQTTKSQLKFVQNVV